MNIAQKIARRIKRRLMPGQKASPLYQTFKYTKPDGSFDYDYYRRVQVAGNALKIEHIFADQETISFIADYLTGALGPVKRGLCHGTRNGAEQRWFKEALGADVIGTDIAPTATDYPDSVMWDFHEQNSEWVGQFDFVYTNAHDHAYDPEKAFNAWFDQLRPGGALIIEHSSKHLVNPRELDPFGVVAEVMPFLVLKWSKGRFAVMDILEPVQKKTNNSAHPIIFVIRACPAPIGSSQG